ncbi:XRE family transcriptional regulator [Rhodopseudomonas sp.]
MSQPKVSALRNYKLEGFSVERLMTLLNALDQATNRSLGSYAGASF